MKRISTIILIILVALMCTNVKAQSYKGFLEGGYTAGVGKYKLNSIDVFTTHGIAVNPQLFFGIGSGAQILSSTEQSTIDWKNHNKDTYKPKDSGVMIPIYFNFRYCFKSEGITPWFDAKAGVSFLTSNHLSVGDDYLDNDVSMFISPAIGVRFPLGKCGLNLGLVYNYTTQRFNYYDRVRRVWVERYGISLHNLGARISLEW